MKSYKKMIAFGLSAFLVANTAFGAELPGGAKAVEADDGVTASGNHADVSGNHADVSGNHVDVSGNDAEVSADDIQEQGIAALSLELTDGLIGYYTFDNTLRNMTGNGSAALHGGAGETWNNPAEGAAAYGQGRHGQAYAFTGDGETRGEGLQLDVKMPAEYTISYWVNPDTVNSATSMVFSPIDLDNGLNVADNWFGKTFPTVRIWGPLAAETDCYLDYFIEETDSLCGQWTYITLTGDAEGRNVLYINGQNVAEGASKTSAFEGCDIFLGINFWDNSFDGLMDDVAIYSRALSEAEVLALYEAEGVLEIKELPYTEHVSVHDPSIIKDEETGMYYVFGSHRAWARSKDLITWQTFVNNLNNVEECEKIFADEIAWAAMGDSTYKVDGNMWAPDVIWNEEMGKWCMYMSINGCSWNSCICLLTADSLDGDWTYVGPVVYSGFTSEATHDFTKTDYTKVTGETTLDSRYAMDAYTCTGNDGKTPTAQTTWNTNYGAHAIDPCIVVGDDGTWYMSYGSWSGGIYMIQLDKVTGLRDYNVVYGCTANESDPYMGYKIAGGNFVSGEASYIQKMGDYYYLYVTLGGLTSTGGYNMRVFRSKDITGPYVDYSGDDARSQTYSYNSSVGNRVMSGYKWSHMSYGYVAQGHNSVMVDSDGRMYLFNHYRFNDGTESHEMRVHQLFINEDGWLVTAPFEYKGETLSDTVTAEEVAGTYEVLFHKLDIDYENLEVVTGEAYSLNADGTVTSNVSGVWDAAGTWEFGSKGAPYVTVNLGETAYKGVFVQQQMEGGKDVVWCFTLLGDDEISVWGCQYLGSDEDMVKNAISNMDMPAGTFVDLTLPAVAGVATVSWSSSNPAVLAVDGKVTAPDEDVKVILTATFDLNTTSVAMEYPITVYAPQTSTENKVLATYFTGEKIDLTDAQKGAYQYDSPFYNGTTKGLQISNGISIRFDLEAAGGADQWLKNILGFNAGNVGGLYFTGNSYLGYNATGGYFDANFRNGNFGDISWGWGTDFLKESAAVEIRILPTGFEVFVNGELAYDQSSIEPYESGKTDYIIPGEVAIAAYADVLAYLQNSANYLNFGWGSWWDGGYCGTISNVVLSALPVDDMNASGITVGTWNFNTPGALDWYDYSNFFGLEGTGDFTLNWKFKNYNPGDYNWRNFAVAVATDMDRTVESSDDWYLRSDAYSNAVFGGGNEKVTYEIDWTWDNYISFMNGAEIDATLTRSGAVMTFYAVISGSDGKTYHYKATVSDAPTEDVMVYLGGENCYLIVTDYTGKADDSVEPTTSPEPTAPPQSTSTPEPTAPPQSTSTPEPTAPPQSTSTPEPTAPPQSTSTPEPTAPPQASGTPEPTTAAASGSGGSSNNADSSTGITVAEDGMYENVVSDWIKIDETIVESAEEEDIRNIDVMISRTFEVPVFVLSDLAGRKVTLALHVGEGIALSITGTDVAETEAPFGVNLVRPAIPEEVKDTVLSKAVRSYEFCFEEQGEFPFHINMHLNFGEENAGKLAVLYRYDEEMAALVVEGTFRVNEDGQAMFGLNRGGQYVAVVLDSIVTYTVVAGDTFGRIAVRHGMTTAALKAVNPDVKNINKIRVGQVLNLY